MKKLGMCAMAAMMMVAPAMAAEKIIVETNDKCSFTITLRSDLAPNHVAQVAKLAAAGFYNGIVFHRVIDGFMAQTGDPTGTGMGGSDEPNLKAEFSKEHFARGTVGMARSSDPDSANSQFFIMFADNSSLDENYTVWGKVDNEGMFCVDRLERGEPPATPDKMVKVTVQ